MGARIDVVCARARLGTMRRKRFVRGAGPAPGPFCVASRDLRRKVNAGDADTFIFVRNEADQVAARGAEVTGPHGLSVLNYVRYRTFRAD